MALHVKTASGWKNATAHVKVNGVWEQARQIYVKINGVWKALLEYSWELGGWSSCSASCGGGTQTRSVTCLRSDGVTLPDSFCAGITKPDTSQPCNTQSCYTYAWYSGSYGSCSAYCGSGTQSRTVYCRRNDGSQVSDSYCSGSKPSTSTSCSNSCYWDYSSYSSCTSTCGTGSQSRTAYCMSNYNGSYSSVATSYCSNSIGSPSTITSCTGCSGCSFNESATVTAKVKQANATGYGGRYNWTYSEVRAALVNAYGSISSWWSSNGRGESVCSWNNATCCKNAGFKYY